MLCHAAPQEVSEFTARAERYVGVTSGGMDQAISVMGMPGTALMVEFNPVSCLEFLKLDFVHLGRPTMLLGRQSASGHARHRPHGGVQPGELLGVF